MGGWLAGWGCKSEEGRAAGGGRHEEKERVVEETEKKDSLGNRGEKKDWTVKLYQGADDWQRTEVEQNI